MNKLLALAGSVVLLGIPSISEAGTLFTNPVIFISPMTMSFGGVATNMTATRTFLVENMGSGKLVGTATVPAPFKIVSGGDYTLRQDEAQVVTVTYTPSGAASDTQTVVFTGGGGAKASVTGQSAPAQPKKLKRK
jgi:hypothetical protein